MSDRGAIQSELTLFVEDLESGRRSWEGNQPEQRGQEVPFVRKRRTVWGQMSTPARKEATGRLDAIHIRCEKKIKSITL